MSELEETPIITGTDEDAKSPESLMEQLRAKRQEIAETRDTFVPITGYGSVGLQAQHRLMERPEVEDIGRKVLQEVKGRGDRQMRILEDQIINSTTGFFIQRTGDIVPQPLLDEQNGDEQILRWDQLAHYLGWTPASHDANARAALYFVFGGNEFAVGQYGILLNRWMGNTSFKVDDVFLGEEE
jgi:hypothetical protein